MNNRTLSNLLFTLACALAGFFLVYALMAR
jgi:hypothetical protein